LDDGFLNGCQTPRHKLRFIASDGSFFDFRAPRSVFYYEKIEKNYGNIGKIVKGAWFIEKFG
jgi:hypothetical protein